jgi:solute carrier family 30 (zinc transporter), member 5/7
MIDHILRTHSRRAIVFALVIIAAASLVDASFSKADLYRTTTAYIGLVIDGILSTTTSYTLSRLTNSFEDQKITRAVIVLSSAVLTIPVHLLGRTIGLLPPYPYVPLLALTPIPCLAYGLLFYYPRTMETTKPHPAQQVFKVAFIPTAALSVLLGPFFSHRLTLSDIPLAILFYNMLQPSAEMRRGTGKSASEPMFRTIQGYLNTILSNSESRKIFYFLLVNLAYMLVQMLYGVWTNSLGLISDGKDFLGYLFLMTDHE